jgi:hypothetical protein
METPQSKKFRTLKLDCSGIKPDVYQYLNNSLTQIMQAPCQYLVLVKNNENDNLSGFISFKYPVSYNYVSTKLDSLKQNIRFDISHFENRKDTRELGKLLSCSKEKVVELGTYWAAKKMHKKRKKINSELVVVSSQTFDAMKSTQSALVKDRYLKELYSLYFILGSWDKYLSDVKIVKCIEEHERFRGKMHWVCEYEKEIVRNIFSIAISCRRYITKDVCAIVAR